MPSESKKPLLTFDDRAGKAPCPRPAGAVAMGRPPERPKVVEIEAVDPPPEPRTTESAAVGKPPVVDFDILSLCVTPVPAAASPLSPAHEPPKVTLGKRIRRFLIGKLAASFFVYVILPSAWGAWVNRETIGQCVGAVSAYIANRTGWVIKSAPDNEASRAVARVTGTEEKKSLIGKLAERVEGPLQPVKDKVKAGVEKVEARAEQVKDDVVEKVDTAKTVATEKIEDTKVALTNSIDRMAGRVSAGEGDGSGGVDSVNEGGSKFAAARNFASRTSQRLAEAVRPRPMTREEQRVALKRWNRAVIAQGEAEQWQQMDYLGRMSDAQKDWETQNAWGAGNQQLMHSSRMIRNAYGR